jgi:hypothetical protein
VALGFVFLVTVMVAELPHELVPFSLDTLEIVVRELAPLRFYLALDGVPIGFYVFPIHRVILSVCC